MVAVGHGRSWSEPHLRTLKWPWFLMVVHDRSWTLVVLGHMPCANLGLRLPPPAAVPMRAPPVGPPERKGHLAMHPGLAPSGDFPSSNKFDAPPPPQERALGSVFKKNN